MIIGTTHRRRRPPARAPRAPRAPRLPPPVRSRWLLLWGSGVLSWAAWQAPWSAGGWPAAVRRRRRRGGRWTWSWVPWGDGPLHHHHHHHQTPSRRCREGNDSRAAGCRAAGPLRLLRRPPHPSRHLHQPPPPSPPLPPLQRRRAPPGSVRTPLRCGKLRLEISIKKKKKRTGKGKGGERREPGGTSSSGGGSSTASSNGGGGGVYR